MWAPSSFAAVIVRASNLRVEVEKRVEALPKLLLDFLARALEHVHGDVSFVTIGQLQGRVVNFGHFALGEQTQAIDQSQIRHAKHLIWCVARDGPVPAERGCPSTINTGNIE
jgi:hypothetical protein